MLYGYLDETKDADRVARATAEASTRTGFVTGLLGLAALGGLLMTARTYRLTEQGHITDRYTKAIEQLGSDKLDVRLGGLYALERIAVDSKRDHPTVVEVLSAFVREHNDPAHTDNEPSVAKVLSTLLQGAGEPSSEHGPGTQQLPAKPNPTADVRAALTVLGRLPSRWGINRADLSNAYFVDAKLSRTVLPGFWVHRG